MKQKMDQRNLSLQYDQAPLPPHSYDKVNQQQLFRLASSEAVNILLL